jgi:hypothetical protein
MQIGGGIDLNGDGNADSARISLVGVAASLMGAAHFGFWV